MRCHGRWQVTEARAENRVITAKKGEAQLAREAHRRALVERLLATSMHDTQGVHALLANARQGCTPQQQEQPEPTSLASERSEER